MTTDDILRMGEEADALADKEIAMPGEYHPDWHDVRDRHFAALVAAEEQARWINAINDEPELPGDMPDAMWSAISNDRDVCTEALRIAVRQTKDAIRARGTK